MIQEEQKEELETAEIPELKSKNSTDNPHVDPLEAQSQINRSVVETNDEKLLKEAEHQAHE